MFGSLPVYNFVITFQILHYEKWFQKYTLLNVCVYNAVPFEICIYISKDAEMFTTYKGSCGLWSRHYLHHVREFSYEYVSFSVMLQFPSVAISLILWRSNRSVNTVGC